MELILNLVWLAIALAAAAHAIRRRRELPVAVALLCVVALLFPIISITDDLCGDLFVAEASVKRRTSQTTQVRDGRLAKVAIGILSLSRTDFTMSLYGFERIRTFSRRASCETRCLPVRAPPLMAL